MKQKRYFSPKRLQEAVSLIIEIYVTSDDKRHRRRRESFFYWNYYALFREEEKEFINALCGKLNMDFPCKMDSYYLIVAPERFIA